MTTRLRTTWLAGGVALLFALAVSGAALGADTVGEPSAPTTDAAPLVTETSPTFVDADGDGIADECDSDVVADEDAAAAAEMAVDTDGDGEISVTEAAHSDRIGGTNCNHGGYVSQVAQAQCDSESSTGADEDGEAASEGETTPTDEAETSEDASPCDDETETETEATTTEPCVEVAAPTFDPEALGEPGGFGAYVSSVAQSDAIGGKNCNHGGAVSEAVHAAKAAAKAQRDAAKAAAKAERAAAKAERAAAKAGKGHGGGH